MGDFRADSHTIHYEQTVMSKSCSGYLISNMQGDGDNLVFRVGLASKAFLDVAFSNSYVYISLSNCTYHTFKVCDYLACIKKKTLFIKHVSGICITQFKCQQFPSK
jgi:hypothetical protein